MLDDVGYDDICGCRKLMVRIHEIIELSLQHPVLFKLLDAKPHCSVLLLGSKKALIAHTITNEPCTYSFLINDPEIMPKLAGASKSSFCKAVEDGVKDALAIIFIDDIDSIAHEHDKPNDLVETRMVGQLLPLVDGLK